MTDVRITTTKDGSLMVSGAVQLVDHEGNEYDLTGRDKVFLCRCGHSANKPFCDGSHRRVGFEADEVAP